PFAAGPRKRRLQVGANPLPPETPVLSTLPLLPHPGHPYPPPCPSRPERWRHRNPGPSEWLPCGGGVRRCLGAALAMAEQRVVLTTMARRLDLAAERPAPERAMHRNVTMIPSRGARVVIAAKHD